MDIKIDFERGTDPYLYRDALYFTLEQFDALTQEQIEEMKDERYNRWYEYVTNPPVSTEPAIDNSPKDELVIAGETYRILQGVPASGAKLIEVNNTWYYRVD